MSWTAAGRSATDSQGASEGETSGRAFSAPLFALPFVVAIRCSDTDAFTRFTFAPGLAAIVMPPGCSPSLTVAGAVPVFVKVTFVVACPFQSTVSVMPLGDAPIRPAGRARSPLTM